MISQGKRTEVMLFARWNGIQLLKDSIQYTQNMTKLLKRLEYNQYGTLEALGNACYTGQMVDHFSCSLDSWLQVYARWKIHLKMHRK